MSINPYIDSLMAQFPFEALTFDDISLVTQYADFLPPETDLSTPFTRNISLNLPFVSAAMDTVTESAMAVAMAMLGGIGVVHKNLTNERQAEIVGRVKHYLNGLIAEPVTFTDNLRLEDVLRAKKTHGYGFSGFPILSEGNGKLVGILTSKDIRFARDRNKPVTEFMTRDLITAPEDTTLHQAYEIMQRNKIGKLPLIDDEGRLVGLYSYADARTLIENEEPMYIRDSRYRLRVAAAISPYDYDRIDTLVAAEADAIVIDTAHGHSKAVIETTRWIKKRHPGIDVVAGNIGTGDAALALRDAGADAVKVGIGPGSICTTRVVAGVGIPQISAVYECARALEDSIPVIADGGIRHSGDVPKALVAGAGSVMMGSKFAGTDESPGEKIIYQGRQYVVYRGMGSLGALQENLGSRQRYGQQDVEAKDLVPQGIEGIVPYAGTVKQIMTQYAGGLRAAMGYCGTRTIDELRRRGRFVRISSAGVTEGHAHDITITKEAPNYRQ